jgi:flagellar protein FlbD
VIVLTRLNGAPFAVNPDLVERLEPTPDTVVTLVDGTRFVVADTVGQVVDAIRRWRASVLAAASDVDLLSAPPCGRCDAEPAETGGAGSAGSVVPLHRRRP